MFQASEGCILVVDDHEQVRGLLKRFLERNGYHVFCASHPAEALELFDDMQAGISLLLTDIDMPGFNGYELARRIHKVKPALRVLYISGAFEKIDDSRDLLPKPLDLSILLSRVEEIFAEEGIAKEKCSTVPKRSSD